MAIKARNKLLYYRYYTYLWRSNPAITRCISGPTPACGGLIQQSLGAITGSEESVIVEADCLWTIQAQENQVINYMIELKEMIDRDQCEEYGLVTFVFYCTNLKIGT